MALMHGWIVRSLDDGRRLLSNGQVVLFCSDLDRPGLMDDKPFAEADLYNLRSAPKSYCKMHATSGRGSMYVGVAIKRDGLPGEFG
jgi:hypothetical protein